MSGLCVFLCTSNYVCLYRVCVHMRTHRLRTTLLLYFFLSCVCVCVIQAKEFYNEALKSHEAHSHSMLALAQLYLAGGQLDACQQQV